MKEHPILFKGEMVRAILSGIKIQTRRTNLKTKYAVGDHLWVKETMNFHGENTIEDGFYGPELQYSADHEPVSEWFPENPKRRVIPSLFMPRKASRITLEVTAIRKERLQDITVRDCLEEGISHDFDPSDPKGSACRVLGAYETLWTSINGPGSWESNPTVKVITFRRLTP